MTHQKSDRSPKRSGGGIKRCGKLALIAICIAAMALSSMLTGCIGCSTGSTGSAGKDSFEILDELEKEGIVPDEWRYLDAKYPWGGEWPNVNRVYMAFINEGQYGSHRSYWLEGVDENALHPGYATEDQEQVFHIITFSKEEDGSYRIGIYMNGLYYKYIPRDELNSHEGVPYKKDEARAFMDYRTDSLVASYTARKTSSGYWEVERVLDDPDLAGDAGSQPDDEELASILRDEGWVSNSYDIDPAGTMDDILNSLCDKGIISEGWRTVKDESQRGNIFVERTVVYIDANNYDTYKHYWLEGVDPSELYPGYNGDLRETGDHVFYEIDMSGIHRDNEPDEYCGIQLKPNVSYYRVNLYENCVYYKLISDTAYNEKKGAFTVDDAIDINRTEDESVVKREYWCHYENGELIVEEVPVSE